MLRAAWILGLVVATAPRALAAPADTLRAEGIAFPVVVRIGERVRLRAALPAPDSQGKLIGPPARSSFGPIDVLASAQSPAGLDSAAWTLELGLFQLGDVDLAAVPLRWEEGGSAVPVRLRTMLVSVEPVVTDSAAADSLREIRGPLPVSLAWRWGRIALAAAVLGAAVLAWVLWRRRRSAEPVPVAPYVPAIPPEVEARIGLKELEEAALPARGRIKEHYARLSLILRTYLERRFAVSAVDFTTDEIRRQLQARGSTGIEVGEDVLALFDEADLVKFARLDPGGEAARLDLRRGRAWVESTAPRAPAGEA